MKIIKAESLWNFNWDGFSEEIFNKYKKDTREGSIIADDCLGLVRIGNLCFDIITRNYENEESVVLDADLYVGGVDSGYGYSSSGYPYDFAGGFTISDEIKTMSYLEFKAYLEIELKNFIYFFKHSGADLIELAHKELNIW